jgi:hypothetical protein
MRLMAVQKLGPSPLDAKKDPTLSRTGLKASRNLFSTVLVEEANILNSWNLLPVVFVPL